MGKVQRIDPRVVPQQCVQFGVMGQVGGSQIPTQHMEHLQFRVSTQIQLLQGTSTPGKIGKGGHVLKIQLGKCGVEAVQMLQSGSTAQIQRFQRRVFVAGQRSQRRKVIQLQRNQVVFTAVEDFQISEILQSVQMLNAALAQIHPGDRIQLILGKKSVAVAVLGLDPKQKRRVGKRFLCQGNGRSLGRGGHSHCGCSPQPQQKSSCIFPYFHDLTSIWPPKRPQCFSGIGSLWAF